MGFSAKVMIDAIQELDKESWQLVKEPAGASNATVAALTQQSGNEVTATAPCDHFWEPGDMQSDFICANCGARSDL